MIRRSINAERVKTADNIDSDVLSFIASTSAEDRYGDVVSQNWELEAYKSNPVILLNHNSNELPIGRGVVDVVDGQLMIDIEFDMGDPKAAEVARKAKAGFLNAVSVGFNPTEIIARADLPEDHYAAGSRGNYYGRSELLEVSIVTIPANSEAVAAKSFAEYGLPPIETIRSMVAVEMEKQALKAGIMRHIAEIQEEEDRFIVTYIKAKPKEEERPSEDMEEGYGMDEEEEEDKKEKAAQPDNSLNNDEAEILNYLLTIGDNYVRA